MRNYAYVTLLNNDAYIYSVIACYSSWLKTRSAYPFYCACTQDVPNETIQNLEELNIKIIMLPKIRGLELLEKKLAASHYNSWIPALQKLAVYGLTQFDKLIFLDADTFVYKNLDHLFDYPHLTAVPDGEGRGTPADKFVRGDHYYKKLNAGMLVIEPSSQLYEKIISSTRSLPADRPWADQNIVSNLYPNWEFEPDKHLPVYYNCFGRHIFEYEKNIPDFSVDKIYLLHLVGRKMSPEYGFENVFNSAQGRKHETYFKLLLDICKSVNEYITAQQVKGKLLRLKPVQLPKYVDLVVPYVDSSDPHWERMFLEYNPISEEVEAINAPNRFRGQGPFFKYFFEGVKKYASWIRKVFLVVQSPSQVPVWIKEYPNVEIVYHEDFIPDKYLPTFNSTCIEMFVPFIKGLSDYFLYANDDMFFYNETSIKDFFNGETLLKTFYTYMKKPVVTMYDHHCLNNYCMIFEKPEKMVPSFLAMHHVIRPYSKKNCLACFEKYKDRILKSISQFRAENNFNMYLYDLYDLKSNKTARTALRCETIFTFNHPRLYDIINKNPQIFCIEDSIKNTSNVYGDTVLNECFSKHYYHNATHFQSSTTYNNASREKTRSAATEVDPSGLDFWFTILK